MNSIFRISKVGDNRWLLGNELMLCSSSYTTSEHHWESISSPGTIYSLSRPQCPPTAEPLLADGLFEEIYTRDDSCVWSLDGVYLKAKRTDETLPITKEDVTLDWLARQKPSFAIPRVVYSTQAGGYDVLLTTTVPGRPLGHVWHVMSEPARGKCADRIVEIILEMASWKSDTMTGVDGAQMPDTWIGAQLGLDRDQRPESLVATCKMLGMGCSQFVFSHNDLGPYNVLVDDDHEVCGIIDFEIGGYVPSEWIKTKFSCIGSLDFRWSEEGPDGLQCTDWRARVNARLGNAGLVDVTKRFIEWRTTWNETVFPTLEKDSARDRMRN